MSVKRLWVASPVLISSLKKKTMPAFNFQHAHPFSFISSFCIFQRYRGLRGCKIHRTGYLSSGSPAWALPPSRRNARQRGGPRQPVPAPPGAPCPKPVAGGGWKMEFCFYNFVTQTPSLIDHTLEV